MNGAGIRDMAMRIREEPMSMSPANWLPYVFKAKIYREIGRRSTPFRGQPGRGLKIFEEIKRTFNCRVPLIYRRARAAFSRTGG